MITTKEESSIYKACDLDSGDDDNREISEIQLGDRMGQAIVQKDV